MATLTKAQLSAQRELDRKANGEFGYKNSGESSAQLMAFVPDKYAMLQLRRIGYGQKVLDECSEELAERLNVGRQFDDESVSKIAGEIFQNRFRQKPDNYLTVRNSLGSNAAAQVALDSMLENDTAAEVPVHVADKAKELARRRAVNVNDPRVQSADPSVHCVEHQGMVYHKVSENTVYPDGQVDGVRIQAGRAITDQEIEQMSTLVAYEHKATLHATGTMSVPFRDSPNSFIMRSVPKLDKDENGRAFVKQELAPRSSGKLKNFTETLPYSMMTGSSYVRKDNTRAHPGVEGGIPEGFSVFMAITPKKI